jgi:hypothetical protein
MVHWNDSNPEYWTKNRLLPTVEESEMMFGAIMSQGLKPIVDVSETE